MTTGRASGSPAVTAGSAPGHSLMPAAGVGRSAGPASRASAEGHRTEVGGSRRAMATPPGPAHAGPGLRPDQRQQPGAHRRSQSCFLRRSCAQLLEQGARGERNDEHEGALFLRCGDRRSGRTVGYTSTAREHDVPAKRQSGSAVASADERMASLRDARSARTVPWVPCGASAPRLLRSERAAGLTFSAENGGHSDA